MKYILFLLVGVIPYARASDLVPYFINTPAQLEDVTAAYVNGGRPKFGQVTPAVPIYLGVVRAFDAPYPPDLTEYLVTALGKLTAYALQQSAVDSSSRNQPWSGVPRTFLTSTYFAPELSHLLGLDVGRDLPRGLWILSRIARDGATPRLRRTARREIDRAIDALTDVAIGRGPLARARRFSAQQGTALKLIHALGGGSNLEMLWFTVHSDQAVKSALWSYVMHERPLGARVDDNPARRIFNFIAEHLTANENSARAGQLLPTLNVLIKCAVRNDLKNLVNRDGPRDLEFLIAGAEPGVVPPSLKTLVAVANTASDPMLRMQTQMMIMDLVKYVVELVEEVPSRTAWLRIATDLLAALDADVGRASLDHFARARNPALAEAALATIRHRCETDLVPNLTESAEFSL